MSRIGSIIAPAIISICKNPVAAVDDERTCKVLMGLSRWSSAEFSERISSYFQPTAIDFSSSPLGEEWCRNLCEKNSVKLIHWSYAIKIAYESSKNDDLNKMISLMQSHQHSSILYPKSPLKLPEVISLPQKEASAHALVSHKSKG